MNTNTNLPAEKKHGMPLIFCTSMSVETALQGQKTVTKLGTVQSSLKGSYGLSGALQFQKQKRRLHYKDHHGEGLEI